MLHRSKTLVDSMATPEGTAQMPRVYKPGESAPVSGEFEIVGPRGGDIGRERTAIRGKPLPPTPLMYPLIFTRCRTPGRRIGFGAGVLRIARRAAAAVPRACWGLDRRAGSLAGTGNGRGAWRCWFAVDDPCRGFRRRRPISSAAGWRRRSGAADGRGVADLRF